jgi:hypothetical protein
VTEVAPTDNALIARLTRDVADRLSERIAVDGQRMAIDDERSYAHMLINAALEHEAHTRLRRGLEPLSVAA